MATRIINLIKTDVYKQFQPDEPNANAQQKQPSESVENQRKSADAENQNNSSINQQGDGFYTPLKSKIINLIEKYEDPKILTSEPSDV